MNRLRERLINFVKTVLGQNRVKHQSIYPLHEAILASDYPRAEHLLVDGEDVNRRDDQSMSPLGWAV
jgi:ankyrin repeat protein